MTPEEILRAGQQARTVMGWLATNVADKPWCPAVIANILRKGRSWGLWQIRAGYLDWMRK